MSYGDYSGPNKADNDKEGGSCNCTRYQAPNAIWYNHGSHYWYCEDCRREVGFDPFNRREWQGGGYGKHLGHPMFETREIIEARKINDL